MSISSYVSRLAEVLVDYSISIKPGEEVLYRSTYEALPLAMEVVRHSVLRGSYPIVMLDDELITETFYKHAVEGVLKHVSKVDKFVMENVNAIITVVSSTHTRYLASIDPERIRIVSAARRELTEIFLRRSAEGSLKWVVTAYPTKALAQEADMSLIDYEGFVFKALKVDRSDPIEEWKRQVEFQFKVVEMLSKASELRFEGPNLDLRLRIDGRKWVNDEGKHNMPGGEIFTAPVEDSVEGIIEYTYPAIWRGREVERVKLRFKEGVVVDASALKGEDFLKRMLETDDGAKRVGELGIGLNYDIARFTKSILFDEKIGGTIHIAIGAAYPETGGVNKSAIHWDMIRDMRESKIYADGDLIYENGKFIRGVI